jgi:hypothetical protein
MIFDLLWEEVGRLAWFRQHRAGGCAGGAGVSLCVYPMSLFSDIRYCQEGLTGALGLIMTLGAKGWPARLGVAGPEAGALLDPKLCWPLKCDPAVKELGVAAWPGCRELGAAAEPSPEGRGLLRPSTSWVCEEVGVAWAEPEGDWVAPCDGEAVPGFASFFLEDLLSLARDSCSCWTCKPSAAELWRRAGLPPAGGTCS